MPGNDLANGRFDFAEVPFRLFDARSSGGPHVQAELTRIDRREEIAADPRQGDEAGEDHQAEDHENQGAMLQVPIEKLDVGIAKLLETPFKSRVKPAEERVAGAVTMTIKTGIGPIRSSPLWNSKRCGLNRTMTR